MKRIRTAITTAMCVGILATVLPPAALSVPALSAHAALRTAHPPVVLIVMENHEYGSIVGSSSAPYLNQKFLPRGTLFTNYYALHHPSLPNYLAMTSGTTSGCLSDTCPTKTYKTNNIFHQLWATGIGWVAWQESMPTPCAVNSSGSYAVKHNPAVYYANLFPKICRRHDLPYPSQQPRQLQPFTYVTPNLCHDMHDCSIATGDHWLRDHVRSLLRAGAIVIITSDEGSTSVGGGGHVMTAIVGPGVSAGTRDGRRFTHHGLLAGLERWFGVKRLHGAATARALPI